MFQIQIINNYIGNLILVIGLFAFSKIILKKKAERSKKEIIFSVLIVSIIHLLVSIVFVNTLKTLLIIIANIWFNIYIFKIDIKKSSILSILHIIILLIPDLFLLLISTSVLNVSKEFYYSSISWSIIGNLATTFLTIAIVYFCRNSLRKIINARLENSIKVIIFSVLILICTLLLFYSFVDEFRFSDNVFAYIISIIGLIIVLFSLIKQIMENKKIRAEYDNLLKFMTTYENELDKQKTLRHETKNEFLAIRIKLFDGTKKKEIAEYLDRILQEKIVIKQEEYAKFGYLPPNGLKGLCYYKTEQARNKGLNIKINISKRLKKSNIYRLNIAEQRDLARLLGVFMDNAIEAANDSKNKNYMIEAYPNRSQECQIIISNSYNKNIDLDKMGKERYSTKGNNRGYGLLLVKHIIKNNHVFENKTTVTDELYSQTITIKNNSSFVCEEFKKLSN